MACISKHLVAYLDAIEARIAYQSMNYANQLFLKLSPFNSLTYIDGIREISMRDCDAKLRYKHIFRCAFTTPSPAVAINTDVYPHQAGHVCAVSDRQWTTI